jgi:hypothetical protein
MNEPSLKRCNVWNSDWLNWVALKYYNGKDDEKEIEEKESGEEARKFMATKTKTKMKNKNKTSRKKKKIQLITKLLCNDIT